MTNDDRLHARPTLWETKGEGGRGARHRSTARVASGAWNIPLAPSASCACHMEIGRCHQRGWQRTAGDTGAVQTRRTGATRKRPAEESKDATPHGDVLRSGA